MKRIFFQLIALSVLASVAAGQSDWESKDFDKWDRDDVKAILSDSDWAQEFKKRWNIGRVIESEVTARVVLRSALPIRMGLLRRLQLDQGYDGMSPEERLEFDKKNAAVYVCPACKNYYIVSVFSSDSRLSQNTVLRKKQYITISNDKGESIELEGFQTRGDPEEIEMIFFFPRAKASTDFIGPGVSKLIFKLDFRVEDLRGFPLREAVFETSKITRDGIIIF